MSTLNAVKGVDNSQQTKQTAEEDGGRVNDYLLITRESVISYKKQDRVSQRIQWEGTTNKQLTFQNNNHNNSSKQTQTNKRVKHTNP